MGMGVGAGAPYTNEMAVAAVEASRGYGSDGYFVPAEISTPTPTRYRLVETGVIAAGTWNVTVGIFLSGTNSGTDIGADIKIDGFSLGAVLSEAVRVGGGFVQSATFAWVWAGGPHDIEYLVFQDTSPGEINVHLSNTTWVRELS